VRASRYDTGVIETPRLALRRFTTDDAPFVLELLNDADFRRYIGDKGVRTREEAEGYILSGPLDSYARLGFGLLLVELKPGLQPIGMCGLLKRDWLDDVDLGFAFLPGFRRQGYALEAASAVLGWARDSRGIRRCLAIATPDNAASLALLARLGFHHERRVRPPNEGAELVLMAADV
jgi:RimJ/RimL family protein N-acetyltransferase